MLKKYFLFASLVVFLYGFISVTGASDTKDFGTIEGTVTDQEGAPLPGVSITIRNIGTNVKYKAVSDAKGFYSFKKLSPGTYELTVEIVGFKTLKMTNIQLSKGGRIIQNIQLEITTLDEEIAVVGGIQAKRISGRPQFASPPAAGYQQQFSTEEYDRIYENRYLDALNNPLSTFSIDVDTASYANVRRFLKNNQFPMKDAVRIEEMINYFSYDYPIPEDKHPFSIYTEISTCPWNLPHRLIHIGLMGKRLKTENLPPSNLVFLLDVSGSMSSFNKLPLLKSAFKLLVSQLQERDRVSIVVYAGAAGLVLPSTSGSQKEKISEAIERLNAGGSTAGGAGIKLAYKAALENYIENGNNRVILATDGDFNVGVSSTSELVRMIEEKREKGIFLTTLGFGMGNYKDSRMEQLADKGNGNYYYIDSLLEAKKVFISEMGGTLFTIAKDVKIQVEFNPTKVKAYRLIGYENRMLKKEDFADDTKDAGELGAGHTVTALYEIIPFGSEEEIPGIDKLKYQETKIKPEAFKSKELMTVRLRYKDPKDVKSKLIVKPLIDKSIELKDSSENFKFSAAVAQLGLLLRDSEFKGHSSYENILSLAQKGKGNDVNGYRAEFIKLVEICKLLGEIKNKDQ